MSDEVLCNALRYEKWDEAADRIEALTAEIAAHKGNADANYSKWVEADAKLAKAVEALRPFAEALKGNYSHQSDALPISMGHGKDDLRWVLPLGDFRRARALLAEIEGEK
jgi:hypothetical protein